MVLVTVRNCVFMQILHLYDQVNGSVTMNYCTLITYFVIMKGIRCPTCIETDEGPRPVYK